MNLLQSSYLQAASIEVLRERLFKFVREMTEAHIPERIPASRIIL